MTAPKLFLTFALCLAFCALPALAQTATAELSGTVTDASGAVVAGAKVTAMNAETGTSREVSTSQTGNYVLTFMQPGMYNVSVEAPGFRKTVQGNIELRVNQRVEVNLQLQLGQVSDTVEVQATSPLLESQSSALGTVVDTQLTSELPLNGRNFIQMATLSPGVNGVGFASTGTIMSGTRPDDRRPGTEIFSNGNREGSNNFLYDGVDNNERLTLSIVLRPAVEAVREFKIQTNLYSADIGRSSGAVVDVITKSGTNQLHGSAFEFLRNSAMDARNFFSPRGTAFPSFRMNQFGGSAGGPVIVPSLYHGKNKTFFFADYEGFRRDAQQLLLGNIPTANMRDGNFTETAAIYDPLTTRAQGSGFARDPFAGNLIPAARFDPIAAKMVRAYPAPTSAARFNNYLANL